MKRSAMVLAAALGWAAAEITNSTYAEQPDKWVNYVEATGSQWIDTGIIGRWNTKIEAKVEWMSLTDSGFVACGDYSTNQRFYLCYCLDSTGKAILSQGTNVIIKLGNGWETRFETNRVYNYTAEFSATNSAGQSTGKVWIDGYGPWSRTEKGLNTGRSLYVFASNRNDDTVAGRSRTRCYGLKIYQGPIDGGAMTLVRDFQPCIKDGHPGLYDAVSDTIFYSITSTDLICDENSEVPDEYIEYVESQGTEVDVDGQLPAYIDTGIIGKSGTKISGEFAILNSEDKGFLGSRAGGNRFYLMQSYNSKITCGYGTHKDNSKTLELGKKYWVETELNAGSQTEKIGADGVTNTVFSATDSTSINTGYPIFLFTCNVNGSPQWFSKARCYGFKMWQNGGIVRDFRPCLKNGVAGLYDDVSKRIFYSPGTPLIYDTVKRSVKPKEVVYVEYIESDGNNTLDTGVPARSGLRAAGDMMWVGPKGDTDSTHLRLWNYENYRYLESTGSANAFYRQQHGYLSAVRATDGYRFFMVHANDAVLDIGYAGSGSVYLSSGGNSISPTLGTKYSFDVTLANGSQTFAWGEFGQPLETVISTNITGTVDTGTTLYLFSSSYWRHRTAARCYGLKIWDGNTLVRDFKPCLVDGKGMLYDEVTKSIYRPSPDIPASRVGNIIFPEETTKLDCYVDYVETNGKQFIDTGVIGKAATTAEFKETSLCTTTETEECFLGSFGNDSRCYLWYHAWNYTLGLGYDVYWRPTKDDPYSIATGAADPSAYKLNSGDTTHARVSFAVGAQTFETIDDATGNVTLCSSRDLTANVDTGRNLFLFAKNDNDSGTPKDLSKSRFYWLKISQGNSDGSNMQLVRDFKPVKLKNGLVVLWDFVENKPYLPQSKTAPYNFTTFPVVGSDGDRIYTSARVIIR